MFGFHHPRRGFAFSTGFSPTFMTTVELVLSASFDFSFVSVVSGPATLGFRARSALGLVCFCGLFDALPIRGFAASPAGLGRSVSASSSACSSPCID